MKLLNIIILLLLLSGSFSLLSSQSAPSCSSFDGEEVLVWDLDACLSNTDSKNNYNYSELITALVTNSNCSSISGSNVYRNTGEHSCSTDVNDDTGTTGRSVCTSYSDIYDWQDNHSEAIRFTFDIVPAAGEEACLKFLSFYEKSDTYVAITNSNEPGIDRYESVDPPSKYGMRILADGVEVFQQVDINTSASWSSEEFDLTGANLCFPTSTSFMVEFLPYDFAIGTNNNVWDIDQIEVAGGCCNPIVLPPCTIGGPCVTAGGQSGTYDADCNCQPDGAGGGSSCVVGEDAPDLIKRY